MDKFKNIIIGFGKAGKTLAKYLAQHDETVLLIERSKQMYGGTCINVGCLPSKNLILNGQRGLDFTTAVNKRGEMTRQLRDKNYHMVADEPLATIWDGSARFIDNHVLAVVMSDGTTKKVRGERIFINTGAVPNWPSIPGLEFGQRIFTSKEAMELEKQPKRLAIIGGGYIGLEFAGMFNSFGTHVTIFDQHTRLLEREDPDIATEVVADLTDAGIEIKPATQLTQVEDNGEKVTLYYQQGDQSNTAKFDAVLVAVGRRPNINSLGLENTDIALTSRGAIQVDDHLRT
ncbi:FAD-dependent oxidoreductase, partial [Lactobacillus helveticus]